MRIRRTATLLAAAAAAVSLSACSLGSGTGGDEERPEAAADAPNIVNIVIDDATAEMVTRKSMPTAISRIKREGTSFESFVVANPICCPSRANLLTGQYGHNNGVLRNAYRQLENKGRVLPRWLQLAGYRTLHVGKYLNGFQAALDDPAQVPWGWDEWYTLLHNAYYDYEVSDNGEVVEFGSEPSDYLTRVLNRKAGELVGEYAAREEPFYLQLDHFAPHPHPPRDGTECSTGAVPDPRDIPDAEDVPIPDKQNLNEADVSDKPWFVRREDRLTPGKMALRENDYQCAVAALHAVDRGIADLLRVLEEAGELDETALVFTSDNGYFYGEHRLDRKEFPYEENLRMPLFVRLPPSLGQERQPARSYGLAASIDLAPTIMELAGADSCDNQGDCRQIDGRSLVPLLDSGGGREWPADRTAVVQLRQTPGEVQRGARACSYVGLRTKDRLYVEHELSAAPDTECVERRSIEHYDLDEDPQQLQNLHASGEDRAKQRELRRRLRELESCEGNVVQEDPGDNPCE